MFVGFGGVYGRTCMCVRTSASLTEEDDDDEDDEASVRRRTVEGTDAVDLLIWWMQHGWVCT